MLYVKALRKFPEFHDVFVVHSTGPPQPPRSTDSLNYVCRGPKRSLEVHGCLWRSVEILGCPRRSVEVRKGSWRLGEVYGGLQRSMEICGGRQRYWGSTGFTRRSMEVQKIFENKIKKHFLKNLFFKIKSKLKKLRGPSLLSWR